MRITVNLPEALGNETRRFARNERISVSRLTATALEHYLTQQKRKMLGERVLRLAGNVHVAEDVHDEIGRGRDDGRP